MLTELIIIFMGFMSRTKEADLKKVAIHNLGCKVNSYEAESMELMLKNAGYEIVPFDEAIIADVYIINTCSVTNIADRKSRQMLEYEELKIDKVSEHTRAYIKIQDGCNQFCSYCIIPYTRGRIRSRAIEDVVDEVRRLADNGYKEVVLTGIHLSSYGRDTGKETLLDVIEAVNSIDGIERIRLGSLEPRIVTDEFVSRISSMKKLCPHFHLSLQSGCDKTLKAMNRKYDTAEYLKGCEILRKYYDNPAITTDVIVGFPGETEEDFKITKAFVEKVHFYEMHIFKYSRRKGTVADTMPDQVDDKIKTARSNELIELANEMSAQYRSTYADSDLSVLIEEKQNIAGKEYYTGYTPNYIRVMISAEEFDKENVCSNSGNGNIINNIYTVKGCGLDKEKLHIIGMENYNG